MKQFLILLILPFMVLSCKAPNPLVGRWQDTSMENFEYIEFDKNGYVSMMIGKELVGGKDWDFFGITNMTYETNDRVIPAQIDIVVTDVEEKAEAGRILGIYLFPDAKTLILRLSAEGGPRPTEFDTTSEEQLTLVRLKMKK